MRKTRMAFKIIIPTALAVFSFIPLSTNHPSEETSWKSSHLLVHPTLSDSQLMAKLEGFKRYQHQSAVIADNAAAAAFAAATPPPPPPHPVTSTGSGLDGIPAAWVPTAICEEGGRNDPNYGYFGIQEWHGFDGYARAGDAPLSVQLAWEASVGQDHPPDAPGECHGY